MLLIAIGGALKNFDKTTNRSLLARYSQVDWKKAKGMRDIISHHYFETDAEVIYDVCKDHIPELAQTIKKMIQELSHEQPPKTLCIHFPSLSSERSNLFLSPRLQKFKSILHKIEGTIPFLHPYPKISVMI